LSRILQVNEYPNYLDLITKYSSELLKELKASPSNVAYYLLRDIYKHKGMDANSIELRGRGASQDELVLSKTENKVGEYLKANKQYNIIEQYKIDSYTVDFFIKDKGIIVEYFGPLHFYPLQTQVDQLSKFRLKYLMERNNSYKVVIVPHFDLERFSTENRTVGYLDKLLNNPYTTYDELKASALFHENYDMFKVIKN
jgi:very-short-patch-repair endonuclease